MKRCVGPMVEANIIVEGARFAGLVAVLALLCGSGLACDKKKAAESADLGQTSADKASFDMADRHLHVWTIADLKVELETPGFTPQNSKPGTYAAALSGGGILVVREAPNAAFQNDLATAKILAGKEGTISKQEKIDNDSWHIEYAKNDIKPPMYTVDIVKNIGGKSLRCSGVYRTQPEAAATAKACLSMRVGD